MGDRGIRNAHRKGAMRYPDSRLVETPYGSRGERRDADVKIRVNIDKRPRWRHSEECDTALRKAPDVAKAQGHILLPGRPLAKQGQQLLDGAPIKNGQ